MTKQNVPFFALAISYLGTITNLMTEAKSIIGVCAAGASLVASLYAIAIARQRLKKTKTQNPFSQSASSAKSVFKRPRSPRLRSRSSRLRKLVAIFVSFCSITGCSHVATTRARGDKALTQSNEQLAEQSR